MLGKILLSMAALMVSCILISLFTGGKDLVALVVSDAIIVVIGVGLLMIRPTKTSFYAKEGFVVVALSWLMMSLLGALPFLFGGVFTNYIDAVFETASGFTTTGATVCEAISAIPHGIGFWRCLISSWAAWACSFSLWRCFRSPRSALCTSCAPRCRGRA